MLIFTLFCFSFFVFISASTSVIGIIARVLVNLTTVASFKVSLACMLSHADAAAVTDDVSFTAVPANNPNPSLVNFKNPPNVGNIKAAIILNKNITDIACAISSSSAFITGAVAAIADLRLLIQKF